MHAGELGRGWPTRDEMGGEGLVSIPGKLVGGAERNSQASRVAAMWPLLLLCLASLAGRAGGADGDSFHAHLLRCRFVGRGEESRIGRERIRRVAKLLNVLLDRGNQQSRVGGAVSRDFIVSDELILGLLDLDQLPEFIRLFGLSF